jgi:DNA invertase Pin-like site-specific DNA recombinase
MSALAEMERGIIAARQKDIHKDRRERGIVWGVDMGPKNKTPEEIKERIFSERSRGRSYRQIADGLNSDGLLSQNGGRWYATTIKNIVDAGIQKDEGEDNGSLDK